MTRLIDADEILRNCNWGNCWYIPREAIEDTPTIDAVEAVRCKDCRFWNNGHRGDTYCHRLGICMTKADDYCSYGERRER